MASGSATTNEDCCCDPCDCFDNYADTAMPDTVYLDSPFGTHTCTKLAATIPVPNTCKGACSDTTIEWDCIYTISQIRHCTSVEKPVDFECDSIENMGPTCFTNCGDINTNTQMLGDIVIVFGEAAPYCKSVTGSVFVADTSYPARLRVRQRLDCSTNTWTINITLEYIFGQQCLVFYKGDYITTRTVIDPITFPTCPAICTEGGTTAFLSGWTFCPVPGGPASPVFDIFWINSDGTETYGCVKASTGWVSHSGWNGSKTFATTIEGVTSGGSCGSCTTTVGSSSARYLTFDTAPMVGSDFLRCGPMGGFSSVATSKVNTDISPMTTIVYQGAVGTPGAFADHTFRVS